MTEISAQKFTQFFLMVCVVLFLGTRAFGQKVLQTQESCLFQYEGKQFLLTSFNIADAWRGLPTSAHVRNVKVQVTSADYRGKSSGHAFYRAKSAFLNDALSPGPKVTQLVHSLSSEVVGPPFLNPESQKIWDVLSRSRKYSAEVWFLEDKYIELKYRNKIYQLQYIAFRRSQQNKRIAAFIKIVESRQITLIPCN